MAAGRMLADLGADVVQVEPPGGSTTRRLSPRSTHGSCVFDAWAANKRGIVLDLDGDEGQRRLRELVKNADFLIESADHGVMAARGLSWTDLSVLNPSLVYVSITAFGSTGPKSEYAPADLVAWAAGGPLDPHRGSNETPLRTSIPQGLVHAATDAVCAALIAHRSRLRTGVGQHVDVSAQASLGLATLAKVLAAAVGDNDAMPKAGTDQSGSGSSTDPRLKKWRCLDGLIEMHLGIGPASGKFTNSLFQWIDESSGLPPRFKYVDWQQAPRMLLQGTLTEDDIRSARCIVRDFFAALTKGEVLQAALDRKLLCVPVHDTHDVSVSPQLSSRGFWVELGEGVRRRRLPGPFAAVSGRKAGDGFAFRRPAPSIGEHDEEIRAEWISRPDRDSFARAEGEPLDGLKVLDLSWVVAGPVIGRALADFGATVVRVESRNKIETARHMSPFINGEAGVENSALYQNCNAGKLGLTLDLRTESAREVLRDLIRWCDVIVESFSPGTLAKWGFDYASLVAEQPDLVMLSTSMNGQSGPMSRLAGYGNVGAALSGFQDSVGWPDQVPVGPFGPYTDYIAPRFALATLLAAIDERERTGRGCYIDISQVEAGVWVQSPEMAAHDLTGAVVRRMGNRDHNAAPHGVYPTLPENGVDRFVAIAIHTDAQWTELADFLGLAGAARWRLAAERLEHQDELDRMLTSWTTGKTAGDIERQLQARGVPAHVSAASADVVADPQLRHRGHFVTVSHKIHGTTVVEGPRFLLSRTPGKVSRAAPVLGEHNNFVLSNLLGYSPERVAALDMEGALI